MGELTVLLEQLAEKLGTTIEYLWGVLMQQAHVESVKNLIVIICSVLFLAVYSIKVVRMLKKWDEIEREDKEVGAIIFGILGGFLAIASFVGIILGIDVFINTTINPEYWVLQEILLGLK